MTPTATLPLPDLSPDVLAFAAEKGVAAFLPGVAAMTRALFPHQRVNILVEQDPELSYHRQIIFEVAQCGLGEEEMIASHDHWCGEIFQHCPATHVHLFGMGWA